VKKGVVQHVEWFVLPVGERAHKLKHVPDADSLMLNADGLFLATKNSHLAMGMREDYAILGDTIIILDDAFLTSEEKRWLGLRRKITRTTFCATYSSSEEC